MVRMTAIGVGPQIFVTLFFRIIKNFYHKISSHLLYSVIVFKIKYFYFAFAMLNEFCYCLAEYHNALVYANTCLKLYIIILLSM